MVKLWKCSDSFPNRWWLIIDGDVVAHWWRCGGSLVEMWWLTGGDVLTKLQYCFELYYFNSFFVVC